MPKIFSKFSAFIPFILILALSFFTWKPLLNKGYFSMHDDQQVVRLQQMDKSLRAGQFPVRWVQDLGFGYGYPVFNFYPPFVYYLGEFFHLVGFSLVVSIKIVWFIALLGSTLAMYVLTKSVLASIFYLYAPYHAIDAYVRGALAELFSFVWLPLILFFSLRNRPIITGIFLGLLMITHNLIFLPFVGIFVLWSLAFRKNFITPVIIAFGLTAFFWLPALWEKQFTLVDQLLIKNLASYKIHFLCPQQLWYGLRGFGGSVAGCTDGISFALGKIYFLVIVISLILSLFRRSWVGIISFLLLTLSLFMTLPYSQFIWDKIPQLWYLQFPWRFLEFAALFSALLAGVLNKKIFFLVLIPLVIFTNSKYFVSQMTIPDATDQKLTSDYQIKWVISSTSFEYLPKDMATKITDLGTVWVDIDETKIQNTEFKIIVGDFEAKQSQFLPDKFFVSGTSQNGGMIQIQTVNFPGWRVWVNGKEGTIYDNNPYKLITIDVPAGDFKVEGKFTDTPVRTLGNLISAIFLSGLIIYGIRRYKE